VLAFVLAALIRVVQQGVGLASAPGRHDQRVCHERSSHLAFIDPPISESTKPAAGQRRAFKSCKLAIQSMFVRSDLTMKQTTLFKLAI
jgi:hypothetical protein